MNPHHWGRNEFELGSFLRAIDGLSEEVAPQRARLSVVHHYGLVDQSTRDAKREVLSIDGASIDYARAVQRSPSERDRLTPDDVVHDFVPAQTCHGVTSVVTIDGHSYDQGTLIHLGYDLIGRNVNGVEYGRNRVAG